MDYTTTEMVNRVKRAIAPGYPSTYNDDELIAFLDEEYREVTIPLVLSCYEDYFVTSKDVAMPADSFTGILMPRRSIGVKLREVLAINSANPTRSVKLPILDYADVGSYNRGCYFKGNRLFVANGETLSGLDTLRLFYYGRAGSLTAETNAAEITAIGASSYTVSTVPSGWVVGTVLDVIQGVPPFELFAEDVTITNIAGNEIFFSELPSEDAVEGDWLSLQETSPVARVPFETFGLIVQGACLKILEAKADPHVEMASNKYQQMMKTTVDLIKPRIDAEPMIKRGGGLMRGF